MSANRVAKEIRGIIDDYWLGKLNIEQARESINRFMDDPEMHLKIQRGENFTGAFKSVMGKKRLEEFERVMK